MFQDQTADIYNSHSHKDVHKNSKKIVSGIFEKCMKAARLFNKETCQERGCQKNVYASKDNLKPDILKKIVTGSHPLKNPLHNININQYIKWCKKESCHGEMKPPVLWYILQKVFFKHALEWV